MKSTVVKMIKAGVPVFFGCDVGKFSSRTQGIMDPALFEYEVGNCRLYYLRYKPLIHTM